ncbi:MAG: cell division protein FtsA [Patescibacteria group bacterium]
MNTVVALELGSEKLACAVASFEIEAGKGPRILGFATAPSKGIKRAQIIDIQETTHALEGCITQAERMAGMRINRASVVISGPSIASQTSHGIVAVNYQNQDIQEADVVRAIDSAKAVSLPANREIIHVLPREFIVDGQGGIKNPVGMRGIRLEVDTHIITAGSTNLNNIQKACSLLGVEVQSYIFAGLASSYAVASDTEKELGCIVLDIGGGTTDVCVYSDGAIVYTSVIPLGSKNVTSDIAAGLRVSLTSAEKIKLFLAESESHTLRKTSSLVKEIESVGDELSVKNLNLIERLESVSKKLLIQGIIKPRLEEIAEYIQKELREFRLKDQTPAGVIITGGGALTPFIDELLKKELALPVRIGYPMELTGISDELRDPSYASLVGTLLYRPEEKKTEPMFSMPDFGNILKKFDLDSVIKKTVDFFKSFIPGTK